MAKYCTSGDTGWTAPVLHSGTEGTLHRAYTDAKKLSRSSHPCDSLQLLTVTRDLIGIELRKKYYLNVVTCTSPKLPFITSFQKEFSAGNRRDMPHTSLLLSPLSVIHPAALIG